MNRKRQSGAILRAVHNYLIFFFVAAFLISCCMMLFVSILTVTLNLQLTKENLEVAAKLTFGNVVLLSLLFTVIDSIRRKWTVDRPAREIKAILKQLMSGNFQARIHTAQIPDRYNHFGEIAESINALAAELSGVETLRTDFISNVSHELKTPLSIINNYAALLQQPELSEEKRLEYAKAITEASKRLVSLISNILKLNKLENQQIYPAAERYNLSEQLCENLLQFEHIWEQKGIDIETKITDNVTICADAELLSLVWNNLLSNAFKFTPNGGTVCVSLQADDTHATVTITDTGCGMTPQVGAHMFEKFYQGDTSHSSQGNGLGLALVKRVVDILHGEIHVESVVGKGSAFTVTIRRIPDGQM